MSNAFWEDMNVDWTDEEFRREFCNAIWQMGFNEGLRVGRMPGNP